MIPLIKSTFYHEQETKRRLASFIRKTKRLSFGQQCELFEKRFAAWQGRKHCVLLNSGSSANLAVIQALLNLERIKKNDFVGFSGLTWSTNVMPLIQLGLRAVSVDVSLDSLNVSGKTLEAILAKYPLKMMFLTDLLGFCDDPDTIAKLCRKHGILLVEDACEALGTVYKGRKLGSFGVASTFSFYVGHHMSTIEGGAVCTDDDELAVMLRLVRAHGWDRNLDFLAQWKIKKDHNVNSPFYSRYTFYDLGYNLRPTEITGFLGNSQLPHLPAIVKKREHNFKVLAKAIYAREDLYYPIRSNHIELLSNFAFPVICKSVALREKLVELCTGIVELRPIVGGDIQAQPFFTKYMKHVSKTPNARLIHEQGLYVGNNPDMSTADLQTIIDLFTLKNVSA